MGVNDWLDVVLLLVCSWVCALAGYWKGRVDGIRWAARIREARSARRVQERHGFAPADEKYMRDNLEHNLRDWPPTDGGAR